MAKSNNVLSRRKERSIRSILGINKIINFVNVPEVLGCLSQSFKFPAQAKLCSSD